MYTEPEPEPEHTCCFTMQSILLTGDWREFDILTFVNGTCEPIYNHQWPRL